MKNQWHQRKFFWLILIVAVLGSSSVFVSIVPRIWREISEAQARKQSLNIPSWAPMVERSQPAVVVITTEAVVEQAPLEIPGLPGPFRYYMPMPPERQRGQGSGFIINEDGEIITNQHVIEGAQSIQVTVGLNPRKYKAVVLGSDELMDIALLKIVTEENEKIRWPYLPLGNSDKLRLGDNVMALGSPLGLVQSVSVGIVSHKHRGGMKPSGRELPLELIQLQIALNPGNSGGPVIDDSGQVQCVGESILASGQNIAFCLPINMVRDGAQQLKQYGKIRRGFLGVRSLELTPEEAKKIGLDPNEVGVVVHEVQAHSPAAIAGIKPEDIILEFDGIKVTGPHNLSAAVMLKAIGQQVKIKIYRKGVGHKELLVKVAEYPGPRASLIHDDNEGLAQLPKISLDKLGVEVTDTSDKIRQELNLLSTNTGARVVSVDHNGKAYHAGIEPNDVIIKFDSVPIMSAEQLQNLSNSIKKKRTEIGVMIRRGPHYLYKQIKN